MLPELKIFLIAMSPLIGLRASVPVALEVYQIPVWSTFLISVIGNLIPVLVLLKVLGPISDYFSRRFYFCNRFFAWLFERTRKKHTKKFEYWKEFALVILIAIPLPLTGPWTGSLCAFVFGIPFKKAFSLITIGTIIAGLIVILITLGTINIINFI